MGSVDQYLEEVIHRGDEMSSMLEKLLAPTLRNRPEAQILTSGTGGIKIIRPPVGKLAVVYSVGGDRNLTSPDSYVNSAMDRLMGASRNIGAQPVAIANVIDSKTADKNIILPYAAALADSANRHQLAVMNGEFAVLGDRMNAEANVSLTALSFIDAGIAPILNGVFERNGITYAVFNPRGRAIYMNSDGVGTKTEVYEREGKLLKAFYDSLAMKLDDLAKIEATAQVVSDVAETNRESLVRRFIPQEGLELLKDQDFMYIVQEEFVGDRISSWKPGELAVNISGSAVSTIDEEFLANPPRPHAGEYLVAIRGNPNPRSNGITDKRRVLADMFGRDWHKTASGKPYLEFMATPSTIFYPVFREALSRGIASSVYHMSGGAYKGKLARPLAKHGLFVDASNLFQPDVREFNMARELGNTPEVSYAKWPMGNEGFATTSRPNDMIELLKRHGLEGRVVGILEEAKDGKTGVLLSDVRGSDGKYVYFSGN